MTSNVISDLLSAIDDLRLAIEAPPTTELEDLIRHLERCEIMAECAEKLEEDEPKKLSLASVRFLMRGIKTVAVEHQDKQFWERMQALADVETEEESFMQTIEFEYAFGDTRAEGYVEILRMLKAIDWEGMLKSLGVTKQIKKMADKGHLLNLTASLSSDSTLESDELEDQLEIRSNASIESCWPRYIAAREKWMKTVAAIEERADKGQLNLMKDDGQLEVLRPGSSSACVSETSNQDDDVLLKASTRCIKAFIHTKDLSHVGQICGRDGDKDYIIQWLLSDTGSNFSAMVIVGEAGVGKTALAKLVYDDSTVKENFSIRAWTHAANASDTQTISKAIFSSITGKSSCSHQESLHLQTIIQEHVNGKRLLLVFDGFEDLHSTPWEQLRAPFSRVRMVKLLITCRRQSGAQETKHLKFYNLASLPPDLSWDLFYKCAFSEGPAFLKIKKKGYRLQAAARLIEMGKQIASKCEGLPLALRVLGGLVGCHRHHNNRWITQLESYQWKSAQSAISFLLRVSLTDLPRRLRECFRYCSVFPKSYKFDKHELVRLWIAQGYTRVEGIGDDYFGELRRLSLLDRSPDGDGTFTMHDLLYDIATSISKNSPGQGIFVHGFLSVKIKSMASIRTGPNSAPVRENFSSISAAQHSFMEGGDACNISDKVRHLYVQIGGDKSTNNLISYPQRLRLFSFFYKSLDGIAPEFLSSFTGHNLLRALELKLHDNSAAAPEMTQRPSLDKSNVSSIDFKIFKSLRYLRVCDKQIESLPASVCQLHLLQTLHLDMCSNLRELPSDIGNLINLRYLGLSNASFQMLPESVCRLINLQSLILDRCRNLSALPDNIGHLSNLHHIRLSGTNIQKLPDSFCNLSKLPILKLENCRQLVEFPSGIGILVNLKSLKARETKINSLPESVCRLSKLLKLDMAGSDLVELPHNICDLFNLSCLALSQTNISVLPESLCRLSSLHTLKLDGCENLACLPSGIGDLANLHELLLSGTNIVELPESICKLSNLQRLELDGCTRFLSLPRSIGQLSSLCHINLSDTEITELPASICQLTNLQTLELNGCHRLSEIPADIGNLINLGDLQVTETQVRELPKSLCQLCELKTLNLNGNRKLQDLPSGIENLSNLRRLELSQVAMEVLPKQICQLSRLEKLTFGYMQKLPTDSY